LGQFQFGVPPVRNLLVVHEACFDSFGQDGRADLVTDN
jgi:hypothetical protein